MHQCNSVFSLNEQHWSSLSSYRAGGGLEGPGGAADAVAVVSMVGGEAGGAGRERRGHGEGAARRGRLRHALLRASVAAVVVAAVAAVAVLKLEAEYIKKKNRVSVFLRVRVIEKIKHGNKPERVSAAVLAAAANHLPPSQPPLHQLTSCPLCLHA